MQFTDSFLLAPTRLKFFVNLYLKTMNLYSILFEGLTDGFKTTTDQGDPLPHHVSLTKFKPYDDSSLLGKEFEIMTDGLVVDKDKQKVSAVRVKLPEDISISTGAVPHITVGLFEGGKPFNSQKLDYGNVIPFEMSLNVMLINALDNKKFMDEYDIEEVKSNTTKGNAQLILSGDSSESLKSAVLEKLTNNNI